MVINKIDLEAEKKLYEAWSEKAPPFLRGKKFFGVSAKTGHGVESLKEYIQSELSSQAPESSGGAILSNARHYHCLLHLRENLQKALVLLEREESPEFIAFELQLCLQKIYEILGLQVEEAVLDRIFGEFCLGK